MNVLRDSKNEDCQLLLSKIKFKNKVQYQDLYYLTDKRWQHRWKSHEFKIGMKFESWIN